MTNYFSVSYATRRTIFLALTGSVCRLWEGGIEDHFKSQNLTSAFKDMVYSTQLTLVASEYQELHSHFFRGRACRLSWKYSINRAETRLPQSIRNTQVRNNWSESYAPHRAPTSKKITCLFGHSINVPGDCRVGSHLVQSFHSPFGMECIRAGRGIFFCIIDDLNLSGNNGY